MNRKFLIAGVEHEAAFPGQQPEFSVTSHAGETRCFCMWCGQVGSSLDEDSMLHLQHCVFGQSIPGAKFVEKPSQLAQHRKSSTFSTALYVIVWQWHDNSGFGVVRAYRLKSDAERDLKMLREYSESKDFKVVEAECL